MIINLSQPNLQLNPNVNGLYKSSKQLSHLLSSPSTFRQMNDTGKRGLDSYLRSTFKKDNKTTNDQLPLVKSLKIELQNQRSMIDNKQRVISCVPNLITSRKSECTSQTNYELYRPNSVRDDKQFQMFKNDLLQRDEEIYHQKEIYDIMINKYQILSNNRNKSSLQSQKERIHLSLNQKQTTSAFNSSNNIELMSGSASRRTYRAPYESLDKEKPKFNPLEYSNLPQQIDKKKQEIKEILFRNKSVELFLETQVTKQDTQESELKTGLNQIPDHKTKQIKKSQDRISEKFKFQEFKSKSKQITEEKVIVKQQIQDFKFKHSKMSSEALIAQQEILNYKQKCTKLQEERDSDHQQMQEYKFKNTRMSQETERAQLMIQEYKSKNAKASTELDSARQEIQDLKKLNTQIIFENEMFKKSIQDLRLQNTQIFNENEMAKYQIQDHKSKQSQLVQENEFQKQLIHDLRCKDTKISQENEKAKYIIDDHQSKYNQLFNENESAKSQILELRQKEVQFTHENKQFEQHKLLLQSNFDDQLQKQVDESMYKYAKLIKDNQKLKKDNVQLAITQVDNKAQITQIQEIIRQFESEKKELEQSNHQKPTSPFSDLESELALILEENSPDKLDLDTKIFIDIDNIEHQQHEKINYQKQIDQYKEYYQRIEDDRAAFKQALRTEIFKSKLEKHTTVKQQHVEVQKQNIWETQLIPSLKDDILIEKKQQDKQNLYISHIDDLSVLQQSMSSTKEAYISVLERLIDQTENQDTELQVIPSHPSQEAIIQKYSQYNLVQKDQVFGLDKGMRSKHLEIKVPTRK